MITSTEIFGSHTSAHPYPLYAHLRAEEPVCRIEPQGWWAISRYSDVATILKTHELFSSDTGLDRMRPAQIDDESWRGLSALRARSIVGVDPPDHTRLRRLLTSAFTPAAIARLETRVRQITLENINRILEKDTFDMVADLAVPLPVTVIAEMLGIGPARRHDFKRWSDDLLAVMQLTRLPAADPAWVAGLVRSRQELTRYFEELIEERRGALGDDLLSDLVRADVLEGTIDPDEVVRLAITLLVAGNETTTHLIGTGTHLLLEHPEALAALRADPALIPAFIEEVLRYEGPAQGLFRRTTAEVTLAGVTIPEGQIVLALLGSANRDPAQFPDPDRFDLRRAARGHVAFGFGIHFCVGAPLSRVEGRIAFEEILRRLPDFSRVDAKPDWSPLSMLHGLRSLQVRFHQAVARVA